MNADFGKNIKFRRLQLGITQSKMSDVTGLSLDMIKSIEQNRTNFSVETLLKLMEALHCSADYILGKTKEPSSDSAKNNEDDS